MTVPTFGWQTLGQIEGEGWYVDARTDSQGHLVLRLRNEDGYAHIVLEGRQLVAFTSAKTNRDSWTAADIARRQETR